MALKISAVRPPVVIAELITLEDRKKSHIQEIDDLDNQKEWVD